MPRARHPLAPTGMRTKGRFLPVSGILALFIGLSAAYALNTPLFEAPDEFAHYLYVNHLARGEGLPAILDDREAQFRSGQVEAHQPPGYYGLIALLTAPLPHPPPEALHAQFPLNPFASVGQQSANNANVHLHPPHPPPVVWTVWVARAASIALSTVVVVGTYWVGVYADGRRTGLLAALFLCGVPTFLHISGSVNNDVLVNAAYALGSAVTLRTWARKRITRADIALTALALAGAALAKTTGLTLFGVVVGAYLIGALRGHYPARAALMLVGIGFAVAALASGWWFARNTMLYGDPFALDATLRVWSRGRAAWPTRAELIGLWQSVWYVLGHLNVNGPGWFAHYATGVTIVGVGGALWTALRHPEKRMRVLFIAGVCVLIFAALMVATRRINVSQGRLLYPALPAFAVMVALGLRRIPFGPWLITPMLAASLLGPSILARSYPRLDEAPPTSMPIFPTASAEGMGHFGVFPTVDVAAPGDTLPVDVVFGGTHPQNPVLFLSSPGGTVEVFPGMARTDSLDPNAIYRARVNLPLDFTETVRPQVLSIAVGWREVDDDDPGQGHHLQWTNADGNPIDAVFVDGPLVIDPAYTPTVTEGAALIFEDCATWETGISLEAAYLYDAGGDTRIQLHWSDEDPTPTSTDYTLTVALLYSAGEIIAQTDAPPPGYPTSRWRADAPLYDTHHLMAPSLTVPGVTALRVGWYAGDVRLPLMSARCGEVRDDLLVVPLIEDR